MAQGQGAILLTLHQQPLQPRQQHQLTLAQAPALPLGQIIADAKRQE